MIRAAVIALGLLLLALTGAARVTAQQLPEIRELRVPERRVTNYFPPGTELRVLPRREWDATVARARQTVAKMHTLDPPHIVKATHDARWDGGVLMGESRLEFANADDRPCAVRLDSWSMACDREESALVPRTRADGSMILWLDEASRPPYMIRWRALPQASSDGRIFALELPAATISSLEIEIPDRMEPIASTGQRTRVGSSKGTETARWRFDAISGPVLIAIRQEQSEQPAFVVSTRIDVGPSLANWVVELAAFIPTRVAQTVSFRLDAGLALDSVAGGDVVSYATSPFEGGSTRVDVQIAETITGRTNLVLRASSKAPADEPWQVPALSALGAALIPGRTVISIDPARTVLECEPLAGEQVPPLRNEAELAPARSAVLAFLARESGPVARLVMGRRSTLAWAGVRGKLTVSASRVFLEAAVTVHRRGSAADSLVLALPEAYEVDTVHIAGLDEPTSWNVESVGGGVRRIRVAVPPYLSGPAPLVINIAISTSPVLTDWVETPRLEVDGAVAVPSTWAAAIDRSWRIEEVDARGVTWVDPIDLSPVASEALPDFSDATLAWQRDEVDARVRIRLAPVGLADAGRSVTVVTLHADHPQIDWYATVSHERGARCTIWVAGTEADLKRIAWTTWRDGAWRPLPAVPERVAKQASTPGTRVSLDLSEPETGHTYTVRATWTPAESAAFDIHRISCGETPIGRRDVLVVAEPGLEPRLGIDAAQVRSPSAVFATARRDFPEAEFDRANVRPVAAATWIQGKDSLSLTVRRLIALQPAPLVREALVVTGRFREGEIAEQLRLDLDTPVDSKLDIALPDFSQLVQVRWADGRASTAVAAGAGTIRVDVPATGHHGAELILDTVRSDRGISTRSDTFALSWPCLAARHCVAGPARVVRLDAIQPWWARLQEWAHRERGSTRRLAVQRGLDQSAPHTLAGLLGRLDESRLLIDRDAMSDQGLGPLSSVDRDSALPILRGAGGSTTSPTLRQVRLGSQIVITSDDALETWNPSDLSSQVYLDGNDASDRFQTLERWSQTAGLGGPELGEIGVHTIEARPGPPREILNREIAPSGTSQRIATVLAALLVAIVGVTRSRISPNRPAGAIMLFVTILGACAAAGQGWAQPLWVGALIGAITVALCWSAGGLADSVRSSRQHASSTVTLPRTASVVLLATLAALAHGAQQPATPSTVSVVVVLVPYADGSPASAGNERVVIKLADYDHIVSLARDAEAATAALAHDRSDGFGAVSVVHRKRIENAGARIESHYTLVGAGAESHTWMVPIGQAVELSASVDGRAVPLQVRSQEAEARVEIEQAGTHKLVISQLVPDRDPAHSQIPVPRISDARSEGFDANASTEASATLIGPKSRIGIGGKPDAEVAIWNETLLWDATPGGDVVHARLKTLSQEPVSTYYFATDSRWQVFAESIAGHQVLLTCRLDESERRWRVDVTPPLQVGSQLSLELVRPAMDGPGVLKRSVPALVDKDKGTGGQSVVVVRAPAGWRMATSAPAQGVGPATALEIIGERSRALESDALHVVGSLSSENGGRLPDIRLERQVSTPRVHTRAEVAVYANRLDVAIDARLTVQSETWPGVQDVELPPDLSIVDVDGDGLEQWSRPGPGVVRLRFRTSDVSSSTGRVRLQGYMTLGDRRLPAQPRLPWPAWPGAKEEDGELRIVDAQELGLQVESTAGLTRLPPESSAAGERPGVAFHVAAGSKPGRLTIGPPVARSDVHVQSYLRFHPSQVEWIAMARYAVRNGPCREIRLELPEPWSNACEVHLLDGEAAVRRIRDGDRSIAIITPRDEAWGPQRVLVHAFASRDAAGRAFPTITPLGLGRVDTFLAWSNESDQPVISDGTAGLQEVDLARFEPLVSGWEFPTSLHVYHVLRGGWSLLLREVGDEAWAAASGPLVEVDCSVGADRAVVGTTRVMRLPRSAMKAELQLPAGVVPLRAYAGGNLVGMALDRERGWCVLQDGGAPAREVTLVWMRARQNGTKGGVLSMAFPELVGARHKSLVTLRLPADWQLDNSSVPAPATEGAREHRWKRLQAIAAAITELAAASRDASAEVRDSLAREVARFKRVERATRADGHAAVGRATRLRESVLEALQPDHSALALQLQNAALGDSDLTAIDPADVLIPRRLGVPHYLSHQPGRPFPQVRTSRMPGIDAALAWRLGWIGAASLVTFGVLFAAARVRSRGRNSWTLAIVSLAVCAAVAPEMWMLGLPIVFWAACRRTGSPAAAASA